MAPGSEEMPNVTTAAYGVVPEALVTPNMDCGRGLAIIATAALLLADTAYEIPMAAVCVPVMAVTEASCTALAPVGAESVAV